MAKITALGYIMKHPYGLTIYGAGMDEDDAWADVLRRVDDFYGPDGRFISRAEARRTRVVAMPATGGLMDAFEYEGGNVNWDVVDGIACTEEEFEAVQQLTDAS